MKSIIQNQIRLSRYLLMVRARKIMVILFFSAITSWSQAQGDLTNVLQSEFEAYQKQALQEKLFVHTDKSVYLTGEMLWFKIYDVDAFFHLPLAVSSVAYVELLDKNNQPVLQTKLGLNKGDGDGAIYLPVTLNSGNYKFRAYTNWMKNFSPDYFFEKSITVFNTQLATNTDSTFQKLPPHADFFPEGGNLVIGLPSKVAFKVTDQYCNGLDFEGVLVSNHNDTILSFRPLKFGMGSFSFTPSVGNTYHAIIRFPGGMQEVNQLPPAYDHGFVMQLTTGESGRLQITVRKSRDASEPAAQSVYLFIHTRQSIKWVSRKPIQNGVAVFSVDSNKLGEGVSQLTVFNEKKEPVCERLYFRYPQKKLQLTVTADQTAYECRKKVNLSVFSGDQTGNPLSADLSLGVYRIDSLQQPDEINIDNYLWLTSDLQGKIESPDYYFHDIRPETAEAMDNLMLTQGWRRFKWEDVLENKKPAFEFIPEYSGHLIYGKISDPKNGLAAKQVNCFLSVPGLYTQFRNALSEEDGRIKFEMKDFYGTREIILQTDPLQDSGYKVEIASPFMDRYTATALPRFSMPEKSPQSLLYASINTQAEDLYIDKKRDQFLTPGIDTAAFYGRPSEKYLLDNYTRFTTLEEVVREYVLGVNLSKTDGKLLLKVIDQATLLRFNGSPLVLLDGVPVLDVDKFIRSYDPLKINKLEVVRRKYFLGYEGFDGILNFTTYAGDLSGYELDPGAIVLDYEGLQLQRRFYSPQYEREDQISSHLPDFRSLLYWAPELKTDALGKANIDFYTSDIPGKYAAVLQGLDVGGRTGSRVIYFEVKNKSK